MCEESAYQPPLQLLVLFAIPKRTQPLNVLVLPALLELGTDLGVKGYKSNQGRQREY